MHNALLGLITLNLKKKAEIAKYFNDADDKDNVFYCKSLIQMAGVEQNGELGDAVRPRERTFGRRS